jgi:hypothetical protein
MNTNISLMAAPNALLARAIDRRSIGPEQRALLYQGSHPATVEPQVCHRYPHMLL